MLQSQLSAIDIARIRRRVRGNHGLQKGMLGFVANPVHKAGPPDRKAHAKLSMRIGDYARMLDSAKTSDNYTGYHKPGSMQR